MYVNVSSSHNLVQDISDMISVGKKPKVFFAVFDTNYQISVLKEALNVLNLKISGCIMEESLLKIRNSNMHNKIKMVTKNTKYPIYNIDEIKHQDNVIVVNNDFNYFNLMVNYFEKHKVNCSLFHYTEIKNSAIVNGTVRVINRIGYLNEWPWFMDILNKDMPDYIRDGFNLNKITGSVISNGDYYHYSDIETVYSKFKDGFRYVANYYPIENKKKYIITLLGDSRFVNAFYPTEMTIASYFQKNLIDCNLNCEIKNFSVEANKIENQFAMLKSLDIGSSDVIISTICPLGQYEDFNIKSVDTRLRIKAHIMREMTDYCHNKGAEILFIHLPHIKDIPNLTSLEKFIADSYGFEYSPDKGHEKTKQLCMANHVNVIDFTDIITNTSRTSFFVDYSHFSPEGSKCIANTLSNYVKCYIEKENLFDNDEINKLTERAYASHKKYVVESRFKGITEYVKKLKKIADGKPKNCGAIVMNCNPFTFGHRYLIEQAKSQVDYLYILAVEEDRSVFKFKDRIEMIRRGVADMPNVEVIPSGKFVISSLTFPEYFEKSKKQDETIDTTADIEIFCEYIAPALNIKTRFVGEEPLDKVTNQYNMCMKEMLPKYGLNLIEIPRKESGNAPISASRVRKLLDEKKYKEIKKLVPTTTFEYLIKELGY